MPATQTEAMAEGSIDRTGARGTAVRRPSGLVAFHYRDFRLLIVLRLASILGLQVLGVAVAWAVYQRTHDVLSLGWVGLVQFLPAVVCTLFAGELADRVDRRRILVAYQAAIAIAGIVLYFAVRLQVSLVLVYATLAWVGTARTFAGPAFQALQAESVDPQDLPNAVAWSSTTWQLANILGPALGGVLAGLAPATVFLVGAGFHLVGITAASVLGPPRRLPSRSNEPSRLASFFAGLHFVRANRQVLGCIALDLFVVLLGGAVALLPVFAQEVLHAGPWALGLLRSAPAAGATTMAAALAWQPITRWQGRWLLGSVTVFGLATIGFGLSRAMVPALCSLFVVGASDMVSVVVRQTVVQLATPSAMRGRVSAVNLVFVGASNELGEFESGVTASWLGTVRAIVAGGVGSVLVAVFWIWGFPEVFRLDRIKHAEAAERS